MFIIESGATLPVYFLSGHFCPGVHLVRPGVRVPHWSGKTFPVVVWTFDHLSDLLSTLLLFWLVTQQISVALCQVYCGSHRSYSRLRP